MANLILSISLIIGLLSCGRSKDSESCEDNGVTHHDSEALAYENSEKAILESLVNQELITVKENDNIQAANESQHDESSIFREMIINEDPIFDFDKPDNTEAEFSKPIMINGASLLLTGSTQCDQLDFQAKAPTLKSLIIDTSANRCGITTVFFCIQLSLKNAKIASTEKKNYHYIETSSLTIDIPCPDQSFNNLKIDIAAGKSHTSNETESIAINTKKQVMEIYLTNNPECNDGGEWSFIGNENPDWKLNWLDGSATVFAKFRDLFGNESNCISDSIELEGKEWLDINETEVIYGTVTDDILAPAEPIAPETQFFSQAFQINLEGGYEENFKEFRFTLIGDPPNSCNDGSPAQVSTIINIPNATTTLYAIACDQEGNASNVMSRTYTYDQSPEAPQAPADRNIYQPTNIYLGGGEEEDFKDFRYTLNGEAPKKCDDGISAQTSTSILIPAETTTLQAISCDLRGNPSELISRAYTFSTVSATISLIPSLNSQTSISLKVGGTDVVEYQYKSILAGQTCSDGTYNNFWIDIETPIELDKSLATGQFTICVIGRTVDPVAQSEDLATSYNSLAQ